MFNINKIPPMTIQNLHISPIVFTYAGEIAKRDFPATVTVPTALFLYEVCSVSVNTQ